MRYFNVLGNEIMFSVMFCGSIRPAISGCSLGSNGSHLPVHWDASVWREGSCHHLCNPCSHVPSHVPSIQSFYSPFYCTRAVPGCPITQPCAARVTNQRPEKTGWGQMLSLAWGLLQHLMDSDTALQGEGCWMSGACPSPKHLKGGILGGKKINTKKE